MNCPVDPWELTQSGNELSRFTSELTEYKMSVGVIPRTLNIVSENQPECNEA